MGNSAEGLLRQMAGIATSFTGRVISADADTLHIACACLDGGSCEARRAASCLLQPEPGDTVLLCAPHGAGLYVLAVLERSSDAPCRLHLGDKAELSASASISLASDELVLRARRATGLIDSLSCIGQELVTSFASVRLIGRLFDSLFERVSQFAGHSTRTVEGLDQTRSAIIDCRAERTLSLHGSEIIATATELAKVDGKQIHIG